MPDSPADLGSAAGAADVALSQSLALEPNTQGGPRRNVEAQVLDVFGEPIPRLYSSGELGSMWGLIYQGVETSW